MIALLMIWDIIFCQIVLPRTEALSIELAPTGDSVLLKKFLDGAMHLELRSMAELSKLRTEWSRKLGFDGVLSTRVLWSRDRTYLTAGVGASKKNAAVSYAVGLKAKKKFVSSPS